MGELHPAMQTYTARGDFTTTLAYVYSEKPFKTYVLVQPQDAGYRLSEICACIMQKVMKNYYNCPFWPLNLAVKFWSHRNHGQNSHRLHWGQTSFCEDQRKAKVCATKAYSTDSKDNFVVSH